MSRLTVVTLFCFLFIATTACERTGVPHGTQVGFGGGTDLGNGSDWIDPMASSHWFPFQSANPLEYCINISDDFGRSRLEMSSLIKRAFQVWESYLTEKKLPRSVLSITTRETETCGETTSLKFLFGPVEGKIANALSGERRRLAVALPEREQSRGTVWIASQNRYGVGIPNWQNEKWIFAELLHEIGHIYGNEHIPSTIMREDLANALEKLPEAWLTQIDHEQELVPCLGCEWSCESPVLDSYGVQRFSNETWAMPKLRLAHIPSQSYLKMLPLPLMSVSFPWQQSFSNLQLFDGEKTVTWTGWGSEIPLFERSGHKAFQFSNENEVLGWESGSVSYVLDFIADNGSEPITLTLKRNSTDAFEIRLPFSPSPISSCNLLGRPQS